MSNIAGKHRTRMLLVCLAALGCVSACRHAVSADIVATPAVKHAAYEWPAITPESKPWTYWYWMGGAVEETELTRHLEQYQAAGFGGVHIIPVYGVHGAEERYVTFLSPKWMGLLDHTLREAKRLNMRVDMTTGTGWPFGGPWIQKPNAAWRFVLEEFRPHASLEFHEPIRPRKAKAASADLVVLMAYGPKGEVVELTDKVGLNGELNWQAPGFDWRAAALFQSTTDLPVERAAPGGQGSTVDHFSREALENYLRRFDEAFGDFSTRRIRSMYNDSYENWGENWTPRLFDEFRERRGYDLGNHLPKLGSIDSSEGARRVRADFRETLADLMHDDFIAAWADWAHGRQMMIRNEAHGSPGNPLDLYALADIPETEVFGTSWLEASGLEPLPGVPARHGGPAHVQVSKLASSAAHVAGRQYCSSETFTWLGDHFKIPLEHMKAQADLMFVLGVNHIFFHGAAYSPSDAPWPGWLWYAATNVGPHMPAWRDMPELCGYVARCQAWLQAGKPNNDVLVYLPIYDLWAEDEGSRDGVQHTTVHNADIWLEKLMPGFAETTSILWQRGYPYDCISDRQIARLESIDGELLSNGNNYRALVIPSCKFMPHSTLEQIERLVEAGATVLIVDKFPNDVPGWGNLENRRKQLRSTILRLQNAERERTASRERPIRRIFVGDDIEQLLTAGGIARESIVDSGLKFVRRRDEAGWIYFLVNQSRDRLKQWASLAVPSKQVAIFDPLTGQSGKAASRHNDKSTEVFLQMGPRQALIVRPMREDSIGPTWKYFCDDSSRELTSTWRVAFIEGGPSLPKERTVNSLSDWTNWPDGNEELKSFSGVARYVTEFDQPVTSGDAWLLDLGDIYHTARIKLNGIDVGSTIAAPHRLDVSHAIRSGVNHLEVEVANLPANRVADLDRRGVDWKYFLFVNIQYQPFDASKWSPLTSGLVGPVKITAQRLLTPAELNQLP